MEQSTINNRDAMIEEEEEENLIAAQIKFEEVFDGRKETPI